jgi:hypothetical protein
MEAGMSDAIKELLTSKDPTIYAEIYAALRLREPAFLEEWKAQGKAALDIVDDLHDVMEWLRDEKLFAQSDRVRTLLSRLANSVPPHPIFGGWDGRDLIRNLARSYPNQLSIKESDSLRTELKEANAEVEALQAQLAEANRALAEWAEVSQRNYQRAIEAEERLAEARGAGWQPIETLPPRFTTVDIWLSGGFRVANAKHPSQYLTATHWWDFGLGQTSPEPPPDTTLAKIDPKP